jgi:predicted flavoprotein YhiN
MSDVDVLVVGGGPAGLRAAEVVSATGKRVVLADHKPSAGRKFLVAGRGGLNLTHSEPVANFPARYGDASDRWPKLLAGFSPEDLRAWALRRSSARADAFFRNRSKPRRYYAAGSRGCARKV